MKFYRRLHMIPDGLFIRDCEGKDLVMLRRRQGVHLFLSYQGPNSDTSFDQTDSRQYYGKLKMRKKNKYVHIFTLRI